MPRLSAVVLLVLLDSVCGNRNAVATISVNNGGQFGDWHPVEYCPSSTYAVGFSMKVERPQGRGDDTALNGISLICNNRDRTVNGGSVYSGIGPWGDWNEEAVCPHGQVMVQFGLRVEPYLAREGDDTSVNDIFFLCDSSSWIFAPGGTSWGNWGSPSNRCPGNTAICGISTKVEPALGRGDDTALNDVLFVCCND